MDNGYFGHAGGALAATHASGSERSGFGRYVAIGQEARERGAFVVSRGSAATHGFGSANASWSALRAIQLHGRVLPRLERDCIAISRTIREMALTVDICFPRSFRASVR